MPNVIWVWNMMTLALHTVIIQLQSVSDFKWSPIDYMLIICTENNRLYYFTLEKIYVKELSFGFVSNKLNWSPKGTKFILSSNSAMIIGDLGIETSNELGSREEDEEEEEYHEEGEKEGENNEEEHDYNEMIEGEEAFNNFKPNQHDNNG